MLRDRQISLSHSNTYKSTQAAAVVISVHVMNSHLTEANMLVLEHWLKKFNVDEDEDDDDERSAASSIELQGIDSAEPTVIQATIKKRRRHELRKIMLSFSPPKERIIYKCREKTYSLDEYCDKMTESASSSWPVLSCMADKMCDIQLPTILGLAERDVNIRIGLNGNKVQLHDKVKWIKVTEFVQQHGRSSHSILI